MTHDEPQNNSSDSGTKVPMTHDKLLAKIDGFDSHAWTKVAGHKTGPNVIFKSGIVTMDLFEYLELGDRSHAKDRTANEMGLEMQELQSALRAVVELHKPERITIEGFKTEYWCMADNNEPTPYPCLTILQIEKELK